MKVLYIASFPSEEYPERNVFNFRSALRLREYVDLEVLRLQLWRPGRRLVSHSMYKGFSITKMSLPYVPAGPYAHSLLLPLWSWLAFKTLSAKYRDVDIIHSVGVSLGGIVGSRLAKELRKPHLTQAIGSDLLISLPKRMIVHNNRSWIDHVDGVLCNSMGLQDEWVRQYPSGPDPIVAYRGTNIKKFHSKRPSRAAADTFLFLGGLRGVPLSEHGLDLKGGLSLMRIWSSLDSDPEFDGRLIFGGPNSDIDQVLHWRDSLKRPDRVSLCGLVAPEDVRSLLEEADVILVPSRSEGLPNLAVEAAAMSRVVFGSAVGGIPEIVSNNRTGLLLPLDDDATWITAMRNASNGAYPLDEWGEAARMVTERYFDSSEYGSSVYKAYESLVSNVKERAT